MSNEVLAGSGYTIMWGRNATFKSGNRATDRHQSFNPMVKSMDFPESMKYVIEQITTANKMYPNIEYDKELGEGTIRFSCFFRDPMLLATIFTYKGIPTSWAGDGSDVMTFNFSNNNDVDVNIWVSLHMEDQSGSSNHLDMFLDGGEVISYKWIIEPGKPLIEEFEIKFAEISIGTETTSVGYAPLMTNGYDDGSFDQTGVAEITTITAVAAAALTTGEYFKIWLANGTGGFTAYYMWVNKDGGGGDPAPSGFTAIELTVTTGDSAATIATAIGAALDGAADNFGTPSVSDTVVTVTQQQTGDIKDAVDVDTTFTIATTTQGVTGVDGGWALWDGAYVVDTCAMVVNCTITWSSAIADLNITGTTTIEFIVPKDSYRTQESLTVKGRYRGVRGPWKATVVGLLKKGNENIVEPITLIASKTQATFKIQYGTTKYLQFTLAYIESVSGGGVEAGKPLEATFNFQGGAASVATYYWTATEVHDPSNYINHTNT